MFLPELFAGAPLPWSYLKEGMGEDEWGWKQGGVTEGIPVLQFVQKVAEFIFQLFFRQGEKGKRFHGRDFLKVEMVAPAKGFVMNGFQIGVQRLKRMGSFPETLELGMMDIAFGLA